jgi:ubiquinone/menaquinone biosynthesis C-methylase UbiE
MSHRHPIFARYYARVSRLMEENVGPYRQRLLDGLSGRVIEVGAGNGLNFVHYPATVTEVIAVEPEPHLRSIAEAGAARAAVSVKVVDATADDLPADEAECDAAVASLVLCSVPDQDRALAEIRRVLKPGGELRFFEHVRAATPWRGRVQQALDVAIWPLLVGGCHCGRDTRAAIERAGFTIDRIDVLTSAETQMTFPTAPQILGSASRR